MIIDSEGDLPGPSDPPVYSRRAAHSTETDTRLVEHVFSLSDQRGKRWGTLLLKSSARTSRSSPVFHQDDLIQGSFELENEKGDALRKITVTVKGSIVSGTMVDDTKTFLDLSVCLWSRKTSAPRTGDCVWPFSIQLPHDAYSASGARASLPETFLERHTRVTVLYEISVHASRSLFLFRADNNFSTRFRYIPRTRPSSPSVLRQLAYRENQSLPGPYEDPAGWETSPTEMAHGSIFRTRQTVIQCTMSLAKPLTYTRGSVIPCWITLESGDLEALDLCSRPDALAVNLRRCVRYQTTSLVSIQDVASTQSFVDCAVATWWTKDEADGTDATYRRNLEGEIRLPIELISSCAMDQFSVSYIVVMSPFNALAFTPASSRPIISVPVEIVTMYAASGPRPLIYAPPAYVTGPTGETPDAQGINYTQISGLRHY
ncbi:hypothetical protein C8J57DRAFT_1198680 [Mycena rebaudengoi]|nr:hypothetical protein C8J57DRAFT_1198680 [Mycena rebaudengoi]